MNELGDALALQIIDRRTIETVAKEIEKIVKNPPSMTCVNVFLNDSSALKYAVIKKVIMSCANITESDCDWFLLMRGIEEELKKFAVIGVKLSDESHD